MLYLVTRGVTLYLCEVTEAFFDVVQTEEVLEKCAHGRAMLALRQLSSPMFLRGN